MRIVFFGTPEFAVPALEALVHAGYDVAAVVTQPDKPVGRGLKMEAPPVKIAAQKLGLKVLQPVSLNVVARGLACPAPSGVYPVESLLSFGALVRRVPRLSRDGGGQAAHEVPRYDIELKNLHADLGICVAYGKIIPKAVLDLFPHGVLNLHPSLLPQYRGPSPIQAAIVNGDSETGVTIMLLDQEMDHGQILKNHKSQITNHSTGGELSKLLAQEGANLLISTIPKWLEGKIVPNEQDHDKATFTKMLEREDGRIDWRTPAEQIERMVRAYDMWPGTFTVWNTKRLKILKTSLLHLTIGCANNATPGYVWRTDDSRLAVNCNPGAIILEQLQAEGKKAMLAEEFRHGNQKFLGNILS